MSKILITGENSFVGKNFIKLSQNSEIDELSLLDHQPEDIDFTKYDVVLHLVAIVHQSKQIEEKEYFRVNTDLCLRTAREAKKAGVKQFVFLSTVKVYGPYDSNMGVWNESSVCNPDDSYGKSKYAAEKALENLIDDNFMVSIVRTPLVYGEEVKANMLSLINLVEKIPILPLGNTNNQRSFTSVQNLVAFLDKIIEKRLSGVFIAKDEQDLSTSELVKIIAKYLNKKLVLLSIPKFVIYLGKKVYPRIFDRLYGSFELENKETLDRLNFKPPLSIEEGLKKMIEAHIKNKAN